MLAVILLFLGLAVIAWRILFPPAQQRQERLQDRADIARIRRAQQRGRR